MSRQRYSVGVPLAPQSMRSLANSPPRLGTGARSAGW